MIRQVYLWVWLQSSDCTQRCILWSPWIWMNPGVMVFGDAKPLLIHHEWVLVAWSLFSASKPRQCRLHSWWGKPQKFCRLFWPSSAGKWILAVAKTFFRNGVRRLVQFGKPGPKFWHCEWTWTTPQRLNPKESPFSMEGQTEKELKIPMKKRRNGKEKSRTRTKPCRFLKAGKETEMIKWRRSKNDRKVNKRRPRH